MNKKDYDYDYIATWETHHLKMIVIHNKRRAPMHTQGFINVRQSSICIFQLSSSEFIHS